MKTQLAALALLSIVAACGEPASDNPDPGDAGADGADDSGVGDTGIADGSGASDAGADGSGAADTGVDGSGSGPDGGGTDGGGTDGGSTDGGGIPPGCGDGVVNGFEECDEGDANSATEPNACRPDCREARCGDNVLDEGEGCDDGAAWSGDGCSASCQPESGDFELEPNNTAATATPVEPGTYRGSLQDRDVDCFALSVREPGWVRARVETAEGCPGDTWLRLIDPAGAIVAQNDADATTRCSLIDPAAASGARYLLSGTYAVCIEGFLGNAIDGYSLTLETDDNACDPGLFPATGGADLDGDTVVDACDDDDDNDRRNDWVDNCPRVPNNGTIEPVAPAADGTIRRWLIAGPFPQSGGTACMPNTDEPAGVEADLQPAYGAWAGAGSTGTVYWRALLDNDDSIAFTDYYGGGTPRSAYAVAYVVSDATVDAQLRLGSDDGVRVWIKGEQVWENSTCRGVTRDQDRIDFTLQEGVNTILFKVRDNGGGWGLTARVTARDGSNLTGIRYSLASTLAESDGQRDSDADGVGDACDPTP